MMLSQFMLSFESLDRKPIEKFKKYFVWVQV